MLYRENYRQRVLIGLGFLCLLLLMGCKKLKTKDPIVYNIFAHIPYDNTPVPGVAYRIVEYKSKNGTLGEEEATGWEISGVTGSDGRASGSFLGKLKTNYSYKIFFDYLGVVLPSGINEVEIMGPKYDQLTRSNPLDNDYEIRVLPYIPIQLNFKSTACVDQNDVFRYKSYNQDELPNHMFTDSTPWLEGEQLNGCVNFEGNYLTRLCGHYIFKWEAIRGGNLTTGIDTFLVGPGISNQINVLW